eukprot:96732_1
MSAHQILFLFVLNMVCYHRTHGQPPILCNETIRGNISNWEDIYMYQFINNEANNGGQYVQFETCDSIFDSILYLYDKDLNTIVTCDDCGNCSDSQINMPYRLTDSIYYIGVGSYFSKYGEYKLRVHCDPYQPFAKPRATCAINDNGIYECICDAQQCQRTIIPCLNNRDCHVICNGYASCYNAVILWPSDNNHYGNITCNGTYACRLINFPIPPKDQPFVYECNEQFECDNAVINCPLNADCLIICSGYESCYFTRINWSPNLVQSRLICNSTHGVGGGCNFETTTPPKYFMYTFDNEYNINNSFSMHMLADNLIVTHEVEIFFEIQLNNLTNDDFEIFAIKNTDNDVHLLSLTIDKANNRLEISYDNIENMFEIHEIIPDNNKYHSVYLAFNKDDQITMKIDDNKYFEMSVINTLSNYFSTVDNNYTYALYIGNHYNSMEVNAKIRNISIIINIWNYYTISNAIIAPQSVCFHATMKIDLILTTPVSAYWNNTLYIFDGGFYQYGHNEFYTGHLNEENANFQITTFPIPYDLMMWSQSFTQINETMFMIDSKSYQLLFALDLSTNNYNVTNFEFDHHHGCLCNNITHLFFETNFKIYIYEISMDQWIESMHSIKVWKGSA